MNPKYVLPKWALKALRIEACHHLLKLMLPREDNLRLGLSHGYDNESKLWDALLNDSFQEHHTSYGNPYNPQAKDGWTFLYSKKLYRHTDGLPDPVQSIWILACGDHQVVTECRWFKIRRQQLPGQYIILNTDRFHELKNYGNPDSLWIGIVRDRREKTKGVPTAQDYKDLLGYARTLQAEQANSEL